MLVLVYTCQNVKLLEISCRGLFFILQQLFLLYFFSNDHLVKIHDRHGDKKHEIQLPG